MGIGRVSTIITVSSLLGTAMAAPSGAAPEFRRADPSAVQAVGPDFNGDGFGDLAVGVPLEDIGTQFDAGAVNVLYGGAAGLSTASSQFWNQNSIAVEDRAEAEDFFGSALAPGDFNGDGFADLGIGADGEGLGAITAAGAVHVLYGSAVGLSATIVPDQFWTQDSPNVEDTAEQGDEFGLTLAAGDFNGDGFADLAIGASHESVGVVADAGGVNVLYGSPSGLSATAVPDQFWTQDSPNVEDIAEQDDEFGVSVAAADFGNSSHADLAIGAWFEDVGPAVDAGGVNVLYGSVTGLTAVSPPDQFWTQDSPNVNDAAEQGDEFGFSLSGANFGNSTHADLAIGVPGENVFTRSGNKVDAGAINVLYGGSLGLSATNNQFWTQNSTDVEDAVETGDSFGQSLAAGNFGNTSQSDLAIGVPFEDVGVVQDAGAVNVLYGAGAGLSATVFPDQFWTQDSPSVEDTVEQGDLLGWRLAAVNFGNSSESDLAIGDLQEDVDTVNGTVADAGAVNVLYGSLSGLSATATPDQLWDQDNTLGVAQVGDHFGWQLAR
jgi:hypothetical protein